MASLIPDSVKDTFNELMGTYADLQTMRIKSQIVKAQGSLAAYDLANITAEQAAARDVTGAYAAAGNSKMLLVGAGLIAVVAVALLVK